MVDAGAIAKAFRLARPGDSGIILTALNDPLADDARRAALASDADLVVVAPAPLRLAILDRAGRPLGYRLITDAPAGPSGAVDSAVAALIEAAGPGEIFADFAFDPADPTIVWLDPYDRRRIAAERALAIAGDILRHRARVARRSFAIGVTRWKRETVAAFLDGPNGPVAFMRDPKEAASAAKAASGRVAVWASRRNEAAEAAAREAGAQLSRIEDGFLRSVGLGASFLPPLSLALDDGGVYYDPSQPSDLETLLATAELDAATLARAAALRQRLIDEDVTKYNVGAAERLDPPAGRLAVLVPGQVEDDASILHGAGEVRTNLALLEAARARRPDAFIVYKPHPDVVAGYRRGAVEDADFKRLADVVVVDGAISALYEACTAVETMTSLAGFEALLRGLEVTTHGQPFYAGWGLTIDLAPPHPRRGRKRTLDELVAATLIRYPLYLDPKTALPCGPETALDRIAEARAYAATPSGKLAAKLRHAYALTRHRLLGPIARRL